MRTKPLMAVGFLSKALAVLVLPGMAWAQTSPSDFTSATRYDVMGRVVGAIAPDPDGAGPLHYQAVRNTYDAAGRVIRVEKGELASWVSEAIKPEDWASYTTFTISQQIDTVYDAMSRKVRETVWSGGTAYQVTQYSYDALGRLECTAVRMNPAVFGSLPASACTLGTEGSFGPDRITKNSYDAAGQLLQVRKAVGTSIEQAYATYSYTPNGKQEYVVDANGNKAKLTWDGFDRQSGWYFPSTTSATAYNPVDQATALATSGAVSSTDFEGYDYDANGNRTSLRKRDGRTFSYTYDALNRMTAKIVPDACVSGYACTNVPGAMTRDVYYGYDLRGLQTYARFDSSSGSDAVLSSYDGFGRLASSTTAMGGVSRTLEYSYYADGSRQQLIHPDGTKSQYTRDGLSRIETIAAISAAGATSNAIEITYTPQGTMGLMRRWLTSGTWGAPTSYTYDGLGRLVALGHDMTDAYDVAYGYAYNPAGQLIQRTRDNDSYAYSGYLNVSRTYAKNGLNQYTSAGPASFTYDANGNLTSDGTNSFVYDAENRMVTAPGGWTLTYDPLGRLWQNSPGGTSGTQMLWDGDELVDEYSLTGVFFSRYVHGDGEDDPLVQFNGPTIASPIYNLADSQGSIVAQADASGNALRVLKYDEYGVQTGNQGRFQYTGQIWLQLGMYYYKARMYSPTLGRFMQADPIGYDDQINLYAYVANDPVNKTDPSGNCAEDLCIGEGIAACLAATPCQVAVAAGIAAIGVWIMGPPKKPDAAPPPPSTSTARSSSAAPPPPEGGPPDRQSKAELQRSERRLEGRVQEHVEKIEQYRKNPDAFDNQGTLARARTPAEREQIIQGRLRSLENQLTKNQGELQKVRDALRKFD